MFNNVFSLTKVLIKSLNDMSLSEKKNIKTSNAGFVVLIIILVLFCVVPLFFTGYIMGQGFIKLDPNINSSIWNIVLPFSMVAILLFSVFTIISVFFFSMDNKILLPLPLKGWEILLARFFTALYMIYLMEAIFLAPIIIGLSAGFSLPIFSYIWVMIILLVLPVIPIAVVGMIFTALSSFINFSKYKSIYNYLLIFFALGLAIGINLYIQTSIGGGDIESTDSLQIMIEAINQTGDSYIKIMPFLIPAVISLTNSNLVIQILSMLLYIVINAVIVFIFIFFFHKIYYKSLKNSDTTFAKGKKMSNQEYEKSSKSVSSFWSSVEVEWKTVVRSPVFFSNTFLMVFIMPILMVVIFIISFNEASLEEGGSMTINDLLFMIQSEKITIGDTTTLLIFLGVFVFFCSMNMSSSTAISRMGNNASFLKYIPIKAIEVINAKIFWGVALSFGLAVIFSIGAVVLNIINLLDMTIILILCLSIFVFVNYLGIFFDVRKPCINWDNESYAVKNNMNSLWYMLVSFLLVGVIVVIGVLIGQISNVFGGYIVAVVILLLSMLGNYLFYRYFSRSSSKVFVNI